MPLPDTTSKPRLAWIILIQEVRGLLMSPALWTMLIVVSLLVGYSFLQAVDLFSRASRTALSYAELARGMNPQAGIFVPTFGAYYLSQTLLLPFVAIRLIGLDKQSGVLKLLLQLRLSTFSLCILKIMAMGLVWGVSMIPAAMALFFWHRLGGHIFVPELAVLLAGHALYSLIVITIAMFAATISDSLPTAAMLCLAATLGSWVLDFAASGHGGILGTLGQVSLTGMLRQFENGLLSTGYIAAFLALAILFFMLTVIWLHPGRRRSAKIGKSLAVIGLLGAGAVMAMLSPIYTDVTENQRHSFNPATTRALRQLSRTLTITIHLNPQDSRLLDMEQGVLARLRRSVQKLNIQYSPSSSTGLFQPAESDQYGLIQYEYGGKKDQSYSNSENEILSIIYHLAGMTVVPDPVPVYKGYPLVADASGSRWWFYLYLPLIFLSIGGYCYLDKSWRTTRQGE
ncbi:MAG: ABC transporter permease [Deltaproteobacteria bacterium]|nr:MAG: ABC transporter permease [Deltaproteobacteria bacterium]